MIRKVKRYFPIQGIMADELEKSKNNPVQQMALGFCAWFVLQHLRGYKPFITKITFEREFKNNL